MQVRDPAGDREPEPGAFDPGLGRPAASEEALEDMGQILGRDAGPVVLDRRLPILALDPRADGDVTPDCRELDRVRNQVHEQSPQQVGIRFHCQAGLDLEADFDRPHGGERLEAGDYLARQLGEPGAGDPQRTLPGLEPGEIEDV